MKEILIKELEKLRQIALESDNQYYQAILGCMKWIINDEVATKEFLVILAKFSAKYYVMNKMADNMDELKRNALLRSIMSKQLDELLEDMKIEKGEGENLEE